MEGVLAIDLGATSGRAVISPININKLYFEEINRFINVPIKKCGVMCWDFDYLFKKILESIEIASKKMKIISVGIDTWGVDFGMLNFQGELLSSPVHYRDSRTKGILAKIAKYVSLDHLYFKTGTQLMEINTLFQLMSVQKQMPSIYFNTDKILMMPDLFNYYLTGETVIEESIASTTQMLMPEKKSWNKELLQQFSLNENFLPRIVKSGHVLGHIKAEYGFNEIKVINICEHDTASAVAAIPFDDEVFISCGTWSLIGIKTEQPIITKESLAYNFTNELGFNSANLFLKNSTGLWIVEELRRDFEVHGESYSFDDITTMVKACEKDVCIVDTDNEQFSKPGDIIQKIKKYAKNTRQNVPESAAEFFKTAYYSLAIKYRNTIQDLEKIKNKQYQKIYLIGGGSKSTYFTQLIADITGKEVITGLYEATVIGNIIIQLIANKKLASLEQAHDLILKSVEFHSYTPK
ncbi:rhamnulokinase/L-fuculokinase [Granulicatella balaenopterae]|uniref:Rhamnulokinase/L-fuculokinase n=1 Tax=Granulicatella balaenopterae TaxID=137733 RepID=A0A1H9J013_9LACT|nr:rhamnulokinase family protein [Granulicatella balaenopterae]SEQ80391.1 rhamnulokinase/L-fuculokinase [Granulicatella balaenopterae]